ncbi:Hypothetical protein, putative [Bodo saltans]|uniref:Uncharacterized protein n=1 Tax=Bodo saltans TaxID=75058 RepID=A0A0S4JCC7_BODSA|nr:Hypothetical protein, putative [Bodo saltans]|eukprot:CUG87142.1 Hypothetical protein, putative [Bodo saltans]
MAELTLWKGWEAVVAPPPEVIADRQSLTSRAAKLPPRLLPRLHRAESLTSSSPPIRDVLHNAAQHMLVQPLSGLLRPNNNDLKAAQVCGFSSVTDLFRRLVAASLSESSSIVAEAASDTAGRSLAAASSPNFVILLEGCHPDLESIAHREFGLVVKYCPLLKWRSVFDLPSHLSRQEVDGKGVRSVEVAGGRSTLSFDHVELRRMISESRPHRKPLLVFLAGLWMLQAGIPWEMFRGSSSSESVAGQPLPSTTTMMTLAQQQQRCLSEITRELGVRVVLEHHCHVDDVPTTASSSREAMKSSNESSSAWSIVQRTGVVSLIAATFPTLDSDSEEMIQSCLLLSPPPVATSSCSSSTTIAPLRIPKQLIMNTHSLHHIVNDLVALIRDIVAWVCVGDPLSTGLVYTVASIGLALLRPSSPRISKLDFFHAIRGHFSSIRNSRALLSPLQTKLLHRVILRCGGASLSLSASPSPLPQHTVAPSKETTNRNYFRTMWHMVARFPPYMEVVSASDPSAPHLATFASHGVVIVVRNPAMVRTALTHAGFEAMPLVLPRVLSRNGNNSATKNNAVTLSPFIINDTTTTTPPPHQSHVLRIGVSPSNMSPAAWKRLLLLLWSLPASDVSSPYFFAWPHDAFTQWIRKTTSQQTSVTTGNVTSSSSDALVVSKAAKKKKDPKKGAMPQLYQHPHVAALVVAGDVPRRDTISAVMTLETLAVTCAEPTSPLAVLIFGPVALGLAKL